MAGVPGGLGPPVDLRTRSSSTCRQARSARNLTSGFQNAETKGTAFAGAFPDVTEFKLVFEPKTGSFVMSGEFFTRMMTSSYKFRPVNAWTPPETAWFYQKFLVASSITFSSEDGRPTLVSNAEMLEFNSVDSFERVPSSQAAGDPGDPLYQGRLSSSSGVNAPPPYGLPYPFFSGFYLEKPMWEISGANFRFFGQNWIRLIKVSGP